MHVQVGKQSEEWIYEELRKDILPFIERRLAASKRLSGKAEAEDVLHHVFVRILPRLESFKDKDFSELRSYVLRAATNRVKDLAKRRSSADVHLDRGDEKGGLRESRVADKGPRATQQIREREFVQTVLKGLSESDATLLRMRYMEDRTPEEISELQSKSLAAVNKALLRARERFDERAAELS